MTKNYSKFFALLAAINKQPGVHLEYRQLVKDFTDNRTNSLNCLTDNEYNLLIANLEKMAPRQEVKNPVHDRTRKAIISQFLSIGKTAKDAIAWAEKYGVSGQKLNFNDYNGQQLYQLLKNAENVKADHLKSIQKKLTGGL